jgi:hypothetical protein
LALKKTTGSGLASKKNKLTQKSLVDKLLKALSKKIPKNAT